MRVPAVFVHFVQWRWTPSFALVAGSLAFVGLAVLIVPDDFDSVASGADEVSRAATRGRATKNFESVSETSPVSTDDESSPPSAEHRTAALPRRPANIVQGIFHPVQKPELPVEAVDPNPSPPPPEAPPAAPTNTIYTLPTPPPAPPTPLAVPGAPGPDPVANPPPAPPPTEPQGTPAEPQGITGQ